MPVPGRRGAAPAGWLVVVAEPGPLGNFERLVARQASIVVGLELMRERVVHETERRLAGDLLADALSGRLEPEELWRPPQALRDREEAAVLVFALDDPTDREDALEAHLADAGVSALVATTAAAGSPLLCAVVADGAAIRSRSPARRARR